MKLLNQQIIDHPLQDKIEQVVRRLKYSISAFQILEWLENFNASDVDAMLTLLENLEYVTEHELIEYLEDRLNTVFEQIPEGMPLYVLPIADFGKSGTLLVYYLKKTLVFREGKRPIKILTDANAVKQKFKTCRNGDKIYFALFDDYFGSGKTLTTYFEQSVSKQTALTRLDVTYFGICVYFQGKTQERLKRMNLPITLIGSEKQGCFERGSSIIGANRLVIRNLAYQYGEDLLFDDKFTAYPLGYNNSQALVVFPYNPPNNTLPILWASRYSVKYKHYWVPLYPRTSHVKIDQAKRIRSNLAFEMSLLKHTELEFDFFSGKKDLNWKSFSFITNTDFKVFGYLRLKMQRKSDIAISQIMGLSQADLEGIQAEGVNRQIFEADIPDVILTPLGKDMYNDVLKALRYFKEQLKFAEKKDFAVREVIYLPSKFKGRTRKLN